MSRQQLNQHGFTLIELIVLILIISIPAIVIIPKLISAKNDTRVAATTAIASALSATNACNYAIRKTTNSIGIPIADCVDVANAMHGAIPSNYTITSATTPVDTSIACTVTGPDSISETFTATGIN